MSKQQIRCASRTHRNLFSPSWPIIFENTVKCAKTHFTVSVYAHKIAKCLELQNAGPCPQIDRQWSFCAEKKIHLLQVKTFATVQTQHHYREMIWLPGRHVDNYMYIWWPGSLISPQNVISPPRYYLLNQDTSFSTKILPSCPILRLPYYLLSQDTSIVPEISPRNLNLVRPRTFHWPTYSSTFCQSY